MDQSIVLPIAVATACFTQLHTNAALTVQACRDLQQRLLERITLFFMNPVTPASTFAFEKDLRQLLDACGRQVLEDAVNRIEPDNAGDAPKHAEREQQDYVRKNQKSPNRGGIATLFGTIELSRCLYEPLQEARDQGQKAFAPLELRLGVVAGNATPALAERVGLLASQHSQQEVLEILKRDHHVCWSVAVLRKVTAAVSAGVATHLQTGWREQVLRWLATAQRSRGRHRVVLSVGRDGIMLPLRGEAHYKEGAVATVSVLDRRGRRLGTVYLGEMPEHLQQTLSDTLTELLQSVLRAWEKPLPRLVYVTDAGFHPTSYFHEVLAKLENPRRPGQRLEWIRVVDFYHAAGYVSQLADLLFRNEKMRKAWSHRMRHVLLHEPHGWFRVLHSAAFHHVPQALTDKENKAYWEAYNYLRNHGQWMDYAQYRRQGLPIGSGVTEAGCKIVFTQRFKESGMTWGQQGGAVILRLRLAVLSGVYESVFENYLQDLSKVAQGVQYTSHQEQHTKVA